MFEPQSPVMQENLPEEEVVQRVRPQKRPDQAEGTEMDSEAPEGRMKPVVESGAVPAPERRPGQTV